jgi:hypothetical protein
VTNKTTMTTKSTLEQLLIAHQAHGIVRFAANAERPPPLGGTDSGNIF